MKAEQKLALTPEQLEDLNRKETRNKLIAIGIGIATSVAAMIVDKKLEKKLLAQFTPEEVEAPEEEA